MNNSDSWTVEEGCELLGRGCCSISVRNAMLRQVAVDGGYASKAKLHAVKTAGVEDVAFHLSTAIGIRVILRVA